MLHESRIFIKGMVCERCIQAVRQTLTQLGFEPTKVTLGEATIISTQKAVATELIEPTLSALGFQLLEDKNSALARQVRELVSEVYSGDFDFPDPFRLSSFISARMQRDYDSISAHFYQVERKTLERYVIDYRVEKIKELLVYSDSPLSDIAFRLNYSSSAYLSRQFHQHTGLTPSYFRQMRKQKDELQREGSS